MPAIEFRRPASKSGQSAPAGTAGAAIRAKWPAVRPRRLSHVLTFTADVDASIKFHERTLGLRLSDRASDLVAFMYGIHGSDHHLLALVKSSALGFHHCSWDVASVNDIGLGAMRMHDKGWTKGWGLGRHVLGSNYFHYVRDPWGSFAEYSCDIDYIPKEVRWWRPTISRRIRSISGVPMCRRNSRSIMRRGRGEDEPFASAVIIHESG